MFNVEKGVVSIYHTIPNPGQEDDTEDAEITIDDEQMRSWIKTLATGEVQDRNLPSEFKYSA